MKTESVWPVRLLSIPQCLMALSFLAVMALTLLYNFNHVDESIAFPIVTRVSPRCPNFLYLITGPDELPLNLSVGLQSNRSHIVMLSYKRQTPSTTIFAPRSTWTQARNMLIDYARQFEVERGCRVDYWTFLDGDLILKPDPVNEYVREYEDFLLEWRPAIGMPQLLKTEYHPFEIQSCAAFDAMFNSFERDVVDLILPYDDSEDKTSWWISQLIVIYKSTRFKDHVLTRLGRLRATNPEHNDYPRNHHLLVEQEKLLGYLIPEPLRHCIGVDINEAVEYWGTPKNRTHPYTVPVRWTHSEILNCRSTLVTRKY